MSPWAGGPVVLPPPPDAPTGPIGPLPRPRDGRRVVVNVLTGVAVLLAGAALAVSLIVDRPVADSEVGASPAVVSGPTGGPADKELCLAVAPLVKEANETNRGFVRLGEAGTPARDAGIGSYQAAVRDWLTRIEPVLDEHPGASGYLTRNLRRYVDDRRIYAAMIRPGPADTMDAAAWTDQMVALGAPYEVCRKLGAWW